MRFRLPSLPHPVTVLYPRLCVRLLLYARPTTHTNTRTNRHSVALRAPSLLHVDVSNNFLQAEGGVSLGLLLRSNHGLTSLNAAACYLKHEGLAAIMSALHTNHTLARLNVADNVFLPRTAACVADMLAVNTSLTWLNIGGAVRGAGSGDDDYEAAPALSTSQVVGDSAATSTSTPRAAASTTKKSQPPSFMAYGGSLTASPGMGDAGLATISRALLNNQVLVHLDVNTHAVTAPAALALCSQLKVGGCAGT